MSSDHDRVHPGAVNWERGLSADALEALVGAMHLDAGFDAARGFVEWVLDDAASVGAAHIDGNYKARGLSRLRLSMMLQNPQPKACLAVRHRVCLGVLRAV